MSQLPQKHRLICAVVLFSGKEYFPLVWFNHCGCCLICCCVVLAARRNNVIVAETRHGGHLGYFQGGLLIPDTITWLDKVVVEFAHAIIITLGAKHNGKLHSAMA